MDQKRIVEEFKKLQDDICRQLEIADGSKKFQEDLWERPGGGGGRSRILQDGSVFEKGGVNFSEVYGKTPERILKALELEEADFFATGVSVVIHPESPMIPIIHMNLRYFEMSSGQSWFGGGIDLTPIYVVTEDARFFHRSLKNVCDRFHAGYYPEFKKWADDYFYIKHRNETRGVGGIFFDHLSESPEITLNQRFDFCLAIGELFSPVYVEIVGRHKSRPFGQSEKDWQLLRRGRYVEFNLVYDVGTKFGLDTGGRAESILMSLPPEVNWLYNFQPSSGSKEAETQHLLVKGVDWLSKGS